MAKISNEIIEAWKTRADSFLATHGLERTRIETGRDAWAIAARTDMTYEAYKDRSITDGHIQTALEKVFPNAVFRDKKVY